MIDEFEEILDIEDITDPKNPSDDVTESTKDLASYCAEAPSTEVRDCIRQYSLSKTYKQQSTSFNSYTKNVIIETLNHLGAKKKLESIKKICMCSRSHLQNPKLAS